MNKIHPHSIAFMFITCTAHDKPKPMFLRRGVRWCVHARITDQ